MRQHDDAQSGVHDDKLGRCFLVQDAQARQGFALEQVSRAASQAGEAAMAMPGACCLQPGSPVDVHQICKAHARIILERALAALQAHEEPPTKEATRQRKGQSFVPSCLVVMGCGSPGFELSSAPQLSLSTVLGH